MSGRGRGAGGGRGRGDGQGGGRGGGRGDYQGGDRGRGRGDYQGGDRGRGRGSYRGGDRGRGRGDYQGRVQEGGRVAGSVGQDYSGPGGDGRVKVPFQRMGPPDIFRPAGSTGTQPPSTNVKGIEDGIIVSQKGLSLAKLSLKSDSISLPARPGYATLGTAITLRTNYFHFKSTAKSPLFRYSVEIVPDEKQKRRRRRIYQLLWGTPKFSPIRRSVASDGGSIIISAVPIPFEGNDDNGKISLAYYEADHEGLGKDSKVYEIIIQKTGTIMVEDLVSYLCSTDAATLMESKEETIQALNIIMAKQASSTDNIVPYGQNKYFVVESGVDHLRDRDLGGCLVALRGYYSSVRTSNARILLNLNACTSAFYAPTSLLAVMDCFLGSRNLPNSRGWPKSKIAKLTSFLKGLRVEVNYLKNNKGLVAKRVKTIIGVGGKDGVASGAAEVKFQSDDGSTSVEEWFSKTHNITVKYKNIPVVNVGNKENPAFIPAELCTIVPGQPYKGRLNEFQTRAMIGLACRLPADNARSITAEGCQVVGVSSAQQEGWLSPFGITVNPSMLTVNARILSPPQIHYSNRKVVTTHEGSWNMLHIRFNAPADIGSWGILRFLPPIQQHDPIGHLKETINYEFRNVLTNCGITVGHQHPTHNVILPGTEVENEAAIMSGLSHFRSPQIIPMPKILLVMLPNPDKTVYSKLKFIADTQFGVHTVCVVVGNLTKGRLGQYFGNLSLKFNLKCGGVNQALTLDKLGPILRDGKTMLVGIDVTHPSPGSAKGTPSIAGVVASIDGRYAQWPASVVLQESKQEMVSSLEKMMKERLIHWHRKNRCLPAKIVIYRDGVGESQYHQILEKELPHIRSAISSTYGSLPKPKLSIIVVGKRHHTRFYPVDETGSDSRGNPKNGTVVDRGITGVRFWDFYLQAHSGLKGTTRPAHYVVVLDEIGLGADGLEQMTHNLCYMFGRATKSVSICPPAYYADLLCERGRCYIHSLLSSGAGSDDDADANYNAAVLLWGEGVHKNIKDSMFYI